ncbi:MAG: HAD family hydrolase [Candidatus Bruticola sp.]
MDKILASNRRILALDFDGVLWDTQREGYIVAQKVWQEIFGRWAFCPMELFLSGRWLANSGEEFGLLLLLGERLCLQEAGVFDKQAEREKIVSSKAERASFESLAVPQKLQGHLREWSEGAEPWQESSDKFPVNVSPISLSSYSLSKFVCDGEQLRCFLSYFGRRLAWLRAECRRSNLQEWLSWQNFYPGTPEIINQALAKFDGLAVCTTKDKASVEALLKTAGLKMLVISKEYTFDKHLQLYILAASFGVEPSQILFVDDLLKNLLRVRPLGVHTALADWGYNNLQARAEAAKLNIPSFSSLAEVLNFFRY